jgi:hypothetical protein
VLLSLTRVEHPLDASRCHPQSYRKPTEISRVSATIGMWKCGVSGVSERFMQRGQSGNLPSVGHAPLAQNGAARAAGLGAEWEIPAISESASRRQSTLRTPRSLLGS